jgi:hypothetical protein
MCKIYNENINFTSTDTKIIIDKVLEHFCKDFIRDPYLCYTEHGQHALFYTMLYNALPPAERDLVFNYHDKQYRVCAIQKEYPTYEGLEKGRRQNWDISILKNQPQLKESYDYLDLSAIIEFGLNEQIEHLIDDFLRISHRQAHADDLYIVHLYRLSKAGNQLSARDRSANAHEIRKLVESQHPKLLDLLRAMSIGNTINIKKFLFDNNIKLKDHDKEKLETRLKNLLNPFPKLVIYFGCIDVSENLIPDKLLYRIENGTITDLLKEI